MCGDRGMFWACLLALAAILGQAEATYSSVYSGFLGCHFSSSVCQPDEECVDDWLFGSCQRLDRPRDYYKYRLTARKLGELADEIEELVGKGYSWESLYTQCVLGNFLLSARRGVKYDRYFCGPASPSPSLEETLTKDSLDLLEKYFQEYYDDIYYNDESQNRASSSLRELESEDLDFPDYGTTLSMPSSSSSMLTDDDWMIPKKKDEFVEIHKYQKSHKRDPLLETYVPGTGTEDDDIAYLRARLAAEEEAEDDAQRDFDYYELLQSLSPEEMDLLQRYLVDLMEQGRSEYADVGEPLPDIPEVQGYRWEDQPEEETGLTTINPGDSQILSGLVKDKTFQSMSSEDARLLLELLTGNRDVSTLSEDQIRRLTQYLDTILATLDGKQTELSSQELEEGDDEGEEKSQEEQDEVEEAGGDGADIIEKPADGDNSVMLAAEENKRGPVDSDEAPVGDMHDHHFDDPMEPVPTKQKYDMLDANYCYLEMNPKTSDPEDAITVTEELAKILGLPADTFTHISVHEGEIEFRVNPNPRGYNASVVATEAMLHGDELANLTGFVVSVAGLGHDESKISIAEVDDGPKYFVLTFVLCGVIAGVVLAVIAIYIVRRYSRSKEKLAQLAATEGGNESQDYQDLCRQRMQSKSSEKPEPIHVASRVGSVSTTENAVRSPSSRSSTSSWSEEPVTSNMDISTGHIVLSYMEDHLKNKDRLEQEWEALCAYEAEPSSTTVGAEPANMRRNRYTDILPYDHSRVVLSTATNVSGSDYINASTITDHDPRNPAYIATQGPLPHSVADFWQMVWEQGSVVIVNLTRLTEQGVAMCHRYWPEEGSDLYHIYEVHLVSEHIWCEDYLVRSLYLKNLQTNETRTVTQFHFLTWPDLGVPTSAKALLDFRRKVNKSYRGRSCPILVHCSDGAGRSGTYCLIDMVLNRMSKGAKEIDIAASLEHIRDQRMQTVKTKEQFEFALASVAEEVHAILKALPQ